MCPPGLLRGEDRAAPPSRRNGLWGRRPDHRGLLVVQRGRAPLPSVPAECGPIGVAVDDEPADAIGIAWATMLSSVAAALVMSLVFSPLMAVLAGVSVVAMVGRSLGSRLVRRRRLARRATQLIAYDAERIEVVGAWRVTEIERRKALATMPTELMLALAEGTWMPWTIRETETVVVPLGAGPETVSLTIGDDPEEAAVILDGVPQCGEIGSGRGLALCGDREPSLRLARWIVSFLASSIGPADLGLILLTTEDRLIDWDWIKWLPGEPLVAVTASEADQVLAHLADGRAYLVVVDGFATRAQGDVASLLSGRRAHAKLVWIGEASEVPAGCATVAAVEADSTMAISRLGEVTTNGEAYGLDASEALTIALALAPLDDPEASSAASDLPTASMLGELIGVDDVADWDIEVRDRWALSTRRSLKAPVGIDRAGVCELDLVADGPHALVAGTTGSGKSEFLRTLVAGLAANHPPRHVSFVLVDFKGGGAFDVVAGLPHVAAVVTDLDAHESARALQSLRAELLEREELLRAEGASSIDELAPSVPLPRLVVVVDEFAALADELPDFLDGLVDVARRGRSLGVHLVLATQRPAGVVTGQIRANTSLRVCLRVQDKADSIDILDRPDGAMLPPIVGRALILRQGMVDDVQIARVGHAKGGTTERPFVLHPAMLDSADASTAEAELDTSGIVLAALVVAGEERASAPWAPLLPARPDWRAATTALGEGALGGDAVGLGWLDDPDRRCHAPFGWRPSEGGLLVIGGDSERLDRTTRLAVAGFASKTPDVPIYVIDGSAGSLGDLTQLPSVGDVIPANEIDRAAKLISMLGGNTRAGAPMLLVLHRFGTIVDQLTDTIGLDTPRVIERLIRDGAVKGLTVIATAGSDREVSTRVSSLFAQRVVHKLADVHSYLALGIKPSDAAGLGANDIVEVGTGRQGRLGWLEDDDLVELARMMPTSISPPPVRVLGERVVRDELPRASASPNGWIVPLGLDEELQAKSVVITQTRPLIVVGQPESGRTTTLASVATSLAPESVFLIDDAEQLDRVTADEAMAEANRLGLPLVIATTPAGLRGFDSWIARLVPSATVLLLNPTRQDGEAVRAMVPDLSRHPIGRSVVIDRGRTSIMQLAA